MLVRHRDPLVTLPPCAQRIVMLQLDHPLRLYSPPSPLSDNNCTLCPSRCPSAPTVTEMGQPVLGMFWCITVAPFVAIVYPASPPTHPSYGTLTRSWHWSTSHRSDTCARDAKTVLSKCGVRQPSRASRFWRATRGPSSPCTPPRPSQVRGCPPHRCLGCARVVCHTCTHSVPSKSRP